MIDSINYWFNGLRASGFILGGRVELSGENTEANLIDGRVKFKLFITPPPPFEVGEFDAEIDLAYLRALVA